MQPSQAPFRSVSSQPDPGLQGFTLEVAKGPNWDEPKKKNTKGQRALTG